QVVFAGAIDKPRALQIRPDLRTIRLALSLRSKNDSELLGRVAVELEGEGFSIESPLTFVPDLAMPSGILTRRKPTRREQRDIAFGWPIAKDLGRLDIGQSVVVHNQMIAAVEAMEGTDRMLMRAGELLQKGGVVIKIFKPGQSLHIDQPSIGVKTIEIMAKTELSCLAVESGSALFFDRQESLKLADRSGISIIGIPEDDFKESSLQGKEDIF
ncbi:MAG: LpxI family protein, partial [Desulfovibrionales bacterium]